MPCNCKYITLYRGDDSDFEFNQKVALLIKTDLSLEGCAAHFSLFGVQQDFQDIPADKTLYLVFPATVTSQFPLGMANGKLWLSDSEGRTRTISRTIHFLVTNDVETAYGYPDGQSISVEIQNIIDYESLANKPKINGVTLKGDVSSADLKILNAEDVFDMECNDWTFRQQLAKLWKMFGGTVVNEEVGA